MLNTIKHYTNTFETPHRRTNLPTNKATRERGLIGGKTMEWGRWKSTPNTIFVYVNVYNPSNILILRYLSQSLAVRLETMRTNMKDASIVVVSFATNSMLAINDNGFFMRRKNESIICCFTYWKLPWDHCQVQIIHEWHHQQRQQKPRLKEKSWWMGSTPQWWWLQWWG